jgi:hypothetical protein
MVKDAKKLRSAYAKGEKKKFQAAFGRLSAAMIARSRAFLLVSPERL